MNFAIGMTDDLNEVRNGYKQQYLSFSAHFAMMSVLQQQMCKHKTAEKACDKCKENSELMNHFSVVFSVLGMSIEENKSLELHKTLCDFARDNFERFPYESAIATFASSRDFPNVDVIFDDKDKNNGA